MKPSGKIPVVFLHFLRFVVICSTTGFDTGLIGDLTFDDAGKDSVPRSVYYDVYDDESSLYYSDGVVDVTCSASFCTGPDQPIDMVNPSNTSLTKRGIFCSEFMENGASSPAKGGVKVRIIIDQYTQLGEYECRVAGETTQTFPLLYRLCPDDYAQCIQGDHDCEKDKEKPFFCIITADKTRSPICSSGASIGADGCRQTGTGHFCPGNSRSLCEAVRDEKYRTTWAQYGGKCESEANTVHFQVGQRKLNYNEAFAYPLEGNDQLKVVCPGSSVFAKVPGVVNCELKTPRGHHKDTIDTKCNQPITFPPHLLTAGTHLLKFTCSLTSGQQWAELSAIMVVMAIEFEPVADPTHPMCHFFGAPLPNFRFDLLHFTDSKNEKVHESKVIDHSDLQGCHGKLVAKVCNVQQRFERPIHGKTRPAGAVTSGPPGPSGPPPGPPGPSPGPPPGPPGQSGPPGKIQQVSTTSGSRSSKGSQFGMLLAVCFFTGATFWTTN